MDIANRLPLLEILKSEFLEYQLFITTYDKPWYEYVKSNLEGAEGWLTMEFYAEETKDGYEIPKIFDNQDLLKKAQSHYKNSDYKAAAVYARAAFEKILRAYCEKKRKEIVFKQKSKDYTAENFWKVVCIDVKHKTKTAIERYRNLVLNPFSHYNTEKSEFKSELENAITTVKHLKAELIELQNKK